MRIEVERPSPSSARTFGPYRVIAPLGRGGMATIYRAVHVESTEQVAVKTVSAANEKVVQSIRREVRALSRIRHPGIVRIVADGVEDGLPWYAMELIEGTTLAQLAQKPRSSTGDLGSAEDADGGGADVAGKRLEFEALITLARAICPGLAYLHGEGLVHRDLKPDNIVLRDDDSPVLVDFGLASVSRRTSREALEVRPDLSGTAAYVSPEAIRGDAVDARSDLYALGCILYEMATGRTPFAAFTKSAVLRGHLESTPTPPSSLAAGLPPAFDALVLALLEKEPRHRLGHADDVARALGEMGARPLRRALPTSRAYLYRPGFVGRRPQVERIEAALGRARASAGSLLLVGGESGIGKTRLVNEMGLRAARSGFRVYSGECRAEGGGALGAFQKPLAQLADRCRAGGEALTAQLFGEGAKILAPYEPTLAALPGVEAMPDPPPLPTADAKLRVFRAMSEVLTRLAEDAPLLLILDDLQYADRLSLDLLAFLARQVGTSPILLMATYRTEEAHAALESLLRSTDTAHLLLERLDDDDVAAMVSDMLADEGPAHLGAYVAKHAEGNPFFVAEYLRAALEAELLSRDASGSWKLRESVADAPELELPLPKVLRELVHRRLENLSADAGALLSAGAVIGRVVDVELLLRVSTRDESRAFDAIEELVRRQVLEDAGPGRVRFTHDKLREVAYGAIDEAELPDLHRRVAELLEGEGSADGPIPYAAIAHHYTRAGLPKRAVEALHHGSAEALSRSAYGAAAEGYEQLLSVGDFSDMRRTEWEHGLGEALLGLGDVQRGKERLVRSLELDGLPVADDKPRIAAGLAAQLSRQMGHRLLPQTMIERPGERAQLLRTTRTYQRLVETHWFENDVGRMVFSALHALNFAERAGPSIELARCYAIVGLAAGSIPVHRVAEHYARLASSTASAVGDPATEAYVLFISSVYRLGTGAFTRVETDLGRAADSQPAHHRPPLPRREPHGARAVGALPERPRPRRRALSLGGGLGTSIRQPAASRVGRRRALGGALPARTVRGRGDAPSPGRGAALGVGATPRVATSSRPQGQHPPRSGRRRRRRALGRARRDVDGEHVGAHVSLPARRLRRHRQRATRALRAGSAPVGGAREARRRLADAIRLPLRHRSSPRLRRAGGPRPPRGPKVARATGLRPGGGGGAAAGDAPRDRPRARAREPPRALTHPGAARV